MYTVTIKGREYRCNKCRTPLIVKGREKGDKIGAVVYKPQHLCPACLNERDSR